MYYVYLAPLNIPAYYTQSHEWVSVEGNKCKVGITDYAQSALGDVVYVQLPDVGEEFEKEGKTLYN